MTFVLTVSLPFAESKVCESSIFVSQASGKTCTTGPTLPYFFKTKALCTCVNIIKQPLHVTIIQNGSAREI